MISPEDIYKRMPYAISLTKSRHDAEDLIHDVYIKIHNSGYQEAGKSTEFINTVILNQFIDTYRKGKTRRAGRQKYLQIIEDCFRPDYETSQINLDVKKRIAKLLFLLPARDSKIFNLYLDGFTQNEIAQIVGWPQKNISSNVGAVIRRTRLKIIEKLKSAYAN